MHTAIRIGELAVRAQCPIQTIRYYERARLLPSPDRSAGNYRLYGEQHVERLLFIRHCRSLDLSLAEILMLLALRDAPGNSCSDVNAVLDAHIVQITRRIDDLRRLREHLKTLRARCGEARAVKDCQILDELSCRGIAPEPGRCEAGTRRERNHSRRSTPISTTDRQIRARDRV